MTAVLVGYEYLRYVLKQELSAADRANVVTNQGHLRLKEVALQYLPELTFGMPA